MKPLALVCLAAGGLLILGCSGGSLDVGSLFGPPKYQYNPGEATRPDSGAASPLAPEGCATLLHQNRPGGSDYIGPPVPGCPGP